MSAPPGLKLVGERGPELINTRGGERIYNARDTKQMLSGGGGDTVINFNGPIGSQKSARVAAMQVAHDLRFGN